VDISVDINVDKRVDISVDSAPDAGRAAAGSQGSAVQSMQPSHPYRSVGGGDHTHTSMVPR
jgi:hypothetical protein